jgi:hypothetical protein
MNRRKELEITLKVRNNLLKSRRLELGLTVAAAARNARIYPGEWCLYENLRRNPFRKDGLLRHSAQAILGFLCCEVQDLWPEAIRRLERAQLQILLDAQDLHPALSENAQRSALGPGTPGAYFDERELRLDVQHVLKALRPREADILSRYFGIDRQPESLTEIADNLGLSVERTRQLKETALGHIRQRPTLRRILEAHAMPTAEALAP